MQYLLDLNEAFESVDREILFSKLECYDVREKIFQIIKDGPSMFLWKNYYFNSTIKQQ